MLGSERGLHQKNRVNNAEKKNGTLSRTHSKFRLRNGAERMFGHVDSHSTSEDDVFTGEKTAFLKLAEIIATLQQKSARVKVERLKDSVEKTIQCLNTFKTAREVLQAEWRSRVQIAIRDVANSQTLQQVKALESKVTEELHRIDAKLIEQGGILASLRDTKDGGNNMEDKGAT